jgi:O-antigen/teichoic acid export membrane protein
MSRRKPFLYLASNGAGQLSHVFAWALAARGLELSQMSKVVVVVAVGTFLSVIIDYGKSGAFLVALSKDPEKRILTIPLFRLLARRWVIFGPIGLLVSYVGSEQNILLALVGLALILALGLERVSLSSGRVLLNQTYFLLVSPVARIFTLGVLVAGVSTESQLFLPTYLCTSAFISTALVTFKTVKRVAQDQKFNLKEMGDLGPYSLSIIAISLDAVILSFLGNPAASAMIGTVSKLAQPLGLIATSAIQSVSVEITRITLKSDLRNVLKVLLLPSLAIIAFVVVFAIFGAEILVTTLGPSYRDAKILLLLLALSVLPGSINQLLSVFIQGFGHFKFLNSMMVSLTILYLIGIALLSDTNVATLGLLIPSYQALGTIILSLRAASILKQLS